MAVPTTLPASWYCDPKILQLERRAVFLKSWFFLGTVSKFQPGQDIRYEIAQIVIYARTSSNGPDKEVKVFEEASVRPSIFHSIRISLV